MPSKRASASAPAKAVEISRSNGWLILLLLALVGGLFSLFGLWPWANGLIPGQAEATAPVAQVRAETAKVASVLAGGPAMWTRLKPMLVPALAESKALQAEVAAWQTYVGSHSLSGSEIYPSVFVLSSKEADAQVFWMYLSGRGKQPKMEILLMKFQPVDGQWRLSNLQTQFQSDLLVTPKGGPGWFGN